VAGGAADGVFFHRANIWCVIQVHPTIKFLTLISVSRTSWSVLEICDLTYPVDFFKYFFVAYLALTTVPFPRTLSEPKLLVICEILHGEHPLHPSPEAPVQTIVGTAFHLGAHRLADQYAK